MISLKAAQKTLQTIIKPANFLPETIKTTRALNRIIAEDQFSQLDLPPFNKSAMDGYAILANDEKRDQYQLLEIVAAGEIAKKKLKAGTTIKIMTGAPVPQGAGKVIPIEYVQEQADKVHIISQTSAQNIAWQAEDLRTGDLVLKAGTKLGPIEIANLIAAGITKIQVYQKPKVTIISTGDEIVDDVKDLKQGKIMNSNAPLLLSLCEQHGLEVIANIKVKDDAALTAKTLKASAIKSDFLIATGGVSVGDFDFIEEALTGLGFKIHFNKIAIKPGKPMTFASHDKQLAFCLPGNPVAVYLTFYLFVLPAVNLLVGKKPQQKYLLLPLAREFNCKVDPKRLAYFPAAIDTNGKLLPIEFHGSAHLAALLNCAGFFLVEPGLGKIMRDELVRFIPLNF